MIRRAAILALVGLAAGACTAAAATLSGTVRGGSLPSPAAGVTDVRAVDLRTLEITGVAEVARSRRWAIRGVRVGTHSVLTSVVRANGALTQAISAPVRARKTGRVVVTTSLGRKRAPRPRPRLGRSRQTEIRLHASTTPVVTVRTFAGSGPLSSFGRGLSTMLVTDLGEGTPECPIRQREGQREDLIAREIALQNSKFIDPTQVITPRPLRQTLEVRGSVTSTGDSITWSIQLVDATTGSVVGGDEGTARGADGILREAPRQIAERLLNQICGARYNVALSLRTDARFASHIASGTISTVLTATGNRSARGAPPTRFTASGPLGYEGLSFIPSNECTLTSPVSNPGSWSVLLEVTSAGRLRVTWEPEAAGVPPTGTATVTCPTMPPVPIAGFPGPSLVNPDPRTFELPIDGGQQTIAGGIQSDGAGWTHSGTITVARLPR